MAGRPSTTVVEKGAISNDDALKAVNKSSKEMDNIVRKVAHLEHCQTSLAKRKQEALGLLVSLEERFEQKEKELEDCRSGYEKISASLQEKTKKRDDLRESVKSCNEQMKSVAQNTIRTCRSAAYNVKELSGNYHSAERAAERGYSCSKEGITPMSARTPRSHDLGGTLGSAGAAALKGESSRSPLQSAR
ncbi:unnamed protein product [Polarella glacialis]|uniref:Uncharacterized protein n=1 Tax=Polarella glacialis TaxID=89957 RepID=A0A813F091_POLGL|nr:unnamed protein product [Polarella glacialis]